MTEFTWTEQILCCRFSGRLDLKTCPVIDADLEQELGKAPEKIVFDLDAIDYISSPFLAICIKTAKSIEPGAFTIINAGPHIKKVFKLANLDHFLNVTS